MKLRIPTALLMGLTLAATPTQAATPKGLADSDWSSIRAAYDAARHAFHPQPNGSLSAHNPSLNWNLSFDSKGFTATSPDASWSWGLELISSLSSPPSTSSNRLSFQRSPQIEEWFINDSRGLEQGWTLSAPAEIHLRVRGNLPAQVSPQSISFGSQLTYSGLKAWDANGKTVPTHFEPTPDGFAVRYDDSRASYPITIDPLAQNAYVKASNTGADDQFGYSVAVSGDTVVVGANQEESSATGINGNQADNTASDAGAAYVFVRSGATWSQQAYLKASNTEASDGFGYAVAISGDTIVVSAPLESSNATSVNGNQTNNSATNSGAAYVFTRTGTTWSQQAYLKASNTSTGYAFGAAVDISGNTLIVSSFGESSNATGVNGDQTNNLAAGSGAAYIFTRSGTTWTQQAYLKASNTGAGDFFGIDVALSGDTALVGAYAESSNASTINGDESNNLASSSGAAYVFTRSGSTWTQQAYLKASNCGANDLFGWSVALSGDTAVVGAYQESSNATGINGNQADNSASSAGAAYVFTRSGTTWSQQAYLKASNSEANDRFGISVALSGDSILVGSLFESSNATGVNGTQANNLTSNSGAAYLFARTGTTWSQQAYLKASNPGIDDRFSWSVALSGDTAVIGALAEGSNAKGVNGNQLDNSSTFAGATYIFGVGESLISLAKSSYSVTGPDLAFGTPGLGALSPSGETLFESALLGSGATSGRNKAIFSTVAGPVNLALQSASNVSGVASLPPGSKIATLTSAVHNRTASSGLFQATVTGPGLSSTNNRLLFQDTGAFIAPVIRTGLPVASLGGAVPSTFREVLQRETAGDQIALSYTLKSGTASVSSTNDSGLLLMNHAGTVTHFSAREGATAIGGGGSFGQFGRAAITDTGYVSFIAKFIPTGGKPLDALFYTGTTSARNIPLQGGQAGGTTTNFAIFTGITRIGSSGLLRATLTNSPTSSNEGVWNESNFLFLRKGQSIGGGLNANRILRVWGINNGQLIAQILLSGTGVNATNNQALILYQANTNFLILLRTGQPAPGIGSNKITVASLQAIDVDPINGHYAILGSLKGAASTANQALWSGITSIGNDTTQQSLRLPKLRLQKGDIYRTESSPGDYIRSIALKPVVDPSGVGGRGFAQQINTNGLILLTLTGDRKIQELVRLTP